MIEEIDVDELAERLAAGARVVDVREPDEYRAGHVAGAISIPLATVPERVEAFRGDGPTYVICQSGARSRRACEFLDAQGLDGVETTTIREHLRDEHAVVAAVADAEIVVVMRERTPFPARLLARLPRLRLLVTSGMRNAALDVAAAAT